MNGEKLFKSMNNINQEWIEQAKPANKPVIMRTRSKIYRNIAAAAAAVIAISGLIYTGVYAYQKYLVPKSNVNFESHISGDSSVNVYNTGNVTSTEESNVDVEWGKYVANGGRFYIELTIKSKDGSPIIPNDDTLSPIIGTFDFADTVIKISDETDQFKSTGTLYHLNYNGMSDDGSEIYAELIYVNADSRDIVNHNISIDVKDLKCTYRNGEDNKTRETRTLATGEWSFETVLKSSSTGVLSTTPNISVTSSYNADQTLNIDTLKCDGFVLDIYGTGNADFKWFGMSGKYAPVVHLKDGTVVSIDDKTSDLSAKAGTMHISFALKQVISVDNIASIEWHGVTIYSAE